MEHYGIQTAAGHLTVSAESKEPYAGDVLASLHADSEQVIARYPQKRSALLPLLHLVQSVDGYVTGRGIDFCAEVLDLSTAEVSGVATFYTQYKRHPNGEYTVGVCTNTLCAIMGGDRIWDEVSDYLGIGHDETTPDGKITLERVECNAACDFAPVVMANWEFFDNQTPESTKQLVDALRDGTDVRPSRGPDKVCTFKQVSRTLAGFSDGLADQGVGAGPASLIGLELAKAKGWTAPNGSAPAIESAPPAAEAAAPVPVEGTPAIVAEIDTAHVDQPAAEQAKVTEAEVGHAQPTLFAEPAPARTPEPATAESDVDDATVARINLVARGGAGSAAYEDDDEAGATVSRSDLAAGSPEKATDRGSHADGGYGEGSAKPADDGSGPAGWDIKGNENSKLFHTPESPWYKRTKAEVWFREAEAAIAAGFTDALERRHQQQSEKPEHTDGKDDA